MLICLKLKLNYIYQLCVITKTIDIILGLIIYQFSHSEARYSCGMLIHYEPGSLFQLRIRHIHSTKVFTVEMRGSVQQQRGTYLVNTHTHLPGNVLEEFFDLCTCR